jgi:hypothetical protein
MPIELKATAPVLVAHDVGATATWYQALLGFKASLFPEQPPFAFAILCRDSIEIMVRRCGNAGPARLDGDWNVYVRTTGVRELLGSLQNRVAIAEPLRLAAYGCVEFAIDDPNGYRLVFSEESEAEVSSRSAP